MIINHFAEEGSVRLTATFEEILPPSRTSSVLRTPPTPLWSTKSQDKFDGPLLTLSFNIEGDWFKGNKVDALSGATCMSVWAVGPGKLQPSRCSGRTSMGVSRLGTSEAA